MVYTVTFNPSLDYIVTVDNFRLGMTNRTTSELMLPGGKGLNVSTVLNSLGVENTAIYYSAGFVGAEITRRLKEMGINADEIRLSSGYSRINTKLCSIEGTEINGAGPDISKEDLDKLYEKLDGLKEGDGLVLAGSIPPSIPDSVYSDIMDKLSERGVRIVVDATKDLLLNVLEYKPFLIKPNNYELGDLFGVELLTRESVVPYAEKLVQRGAENVLVSMAGDGAVLVASNGEVIMREAPKGKLVNGVGAGDTMVAGFLAGYMETGDLCHAFKMGLCAGSASAYSDKLATKEEIEALYRTL
ncbi:MAG: 1-phosphofructokinase [Eubacterium sp.]|nr:1-phosphofructokinase [Eubacterium sp.]